MVCNNVLGLYSRQLGKSNTGDPKAYLLGWKNYMGFIGFLIHKIYIVFHWKISLSATLEFLKSALSSKYLTNYVIPSSQKPSVIMGNNKQPVGERRRLGGGEGGEEEDIISPLCTSCQPRCSSYYIVQWEAHSTTVPPSFPISLYNSLQYLEDVEALSRPTRPSQQQQKASIVEQRPPALQPRFRQTTYQLLHALVA